MIDLIRAEWIKYRSIRSTVITLAVAGGLAVLVAVLVARYANNHGEATNLADLTSGLGLAVLLFGALGVQVVGSEYRFNTIRPTFTAAPHRVRVIIAKVIVACAASAVVSTAMVAACWLVGTVYAHDFEVRGIDHRIAASCCSAPCGPRPGSGSGPSCASPSRGSW
ncbi:MAG: ABC transporter permease [Acidimicrobiales bacterium]